MMVMRVGVRIVGELQPTRPADKGSTLEPDNRPELCPESR